MKKKTKMNIILIILFIVAVILLVLNFTGCESTPLKSTQVSEQNEKLADIQKASAAIKKAVDGNNNLTQTSVDNSKASWTAIQKSINTFSSQAAKSSSASAEKIEQLIQTTTSTNNSTVLMAIIVGILALIILVLIAVLAGVIYKLIQMKFQIRRVIQSDDNNLNDVIWEKHKKKSPPPGV